MLESYNIVTYIFNNLTTARGIETQKKILWIHRKLIVLFIQQTGHS